MGYSCPKCGGKDFRVSYTRKVVEGKPKQRIAVCQNCCSKVLQEIETKLIIGESNEQFTFNHKPD
jgi:transcriptional regulator NrdR family protein